MSVTIAMKAAGHENERRPSPSMREVLRLSRPEDKYFAGTLERASRTG
jgi:hypothetical protein